MPRPSSRASESEGELGLTTLLGDGDASIVGRGRAMESATSGFCDATIVAEQVPDKEPVLVSSHVPVTVIDSAPTDSTTRATCSDHYIWDRTYGNKVLVPAATSADPYTDFLRARNAGRT